MSHLITRGFLPLKCDIITPDDKNASDFMVYRVPSSFNTNISVTDNSDTITLYSGSSYYLEGTVQAVMPYGRIWYQFYDSTNATSIGQEVYTTMWNSPAVDPRISRKVARALVLDSDISGASLDVKLKINQIEQRAEYTTQTNWTLSASGYFNTTFGTPSVRIWQLPS